MKKEGRAFRNIGKYIPSLCNQPANFRILQFKHFCYGIYVRPKGNWGTGEQGQKTYGKMGKGKKILVKQGVSTDRSAPGPLQIIAETNKSLLRVDSSFSFMPYYSSDFKSMSPINVVKIFATKVKN